MPNSDKAKIKELKKTISRLRKENEMLLRALGPVISCDMTSLRSVSLQARQYVYDTVPQVIAKWHEVIVKTSERTITFDEYGSYEDSYFPRWVYHGFKSILESQKKFKKIMEKQYGIHHRQYSQEEQCIIPSSGSVSAKCSNLGSFRQNS